MPWTFSQLGKIRAGGGQRLPPLFHYPAPGYPTAIDDVYQGTLYDLRQWAMQPA